MPTEDAATLIRRYVRLHNEGVRSGDFSAIRSLLDKQAVLTFWGVDVGPFRGSEAIVEAFQRHPPDDELVLLDTCGDPGCITGRYAWAREPQRVAGQVGVESRDGRIMRLTIRATGARGGQLR